MDKKRLEDIKEKYSEVTVLEYINDIEIVGVDMKDLVWLINRVEELEEERDEWKDTAQSYYMTNQELREQNKRYKQALEEIARGRFPGASYRAREALEGET